MGKFQAGQQKPRGSGRKQGSRNKRSEHIETTLRIIGLNVPERILELLPQLSVDKQADVLLNLMAYLYPKRKAVEILDSHKEENKIAIHFIKPNKTTHEF